MEREHIFLGVCREICEWEVSGRAHLEEPLEKSESKQTEFFVREVKVKRLTKNGPEFLIGLRDFPLQKRWYLNSLSQF